MPDTDGTEFATPIPLRDKGSGGLESAARHLSEQPNPFSRLEGIDVVLQQLELLVAELLTAPPQRVDSRAVGQVLRELSAPLRAALWGDLAAVRQVVDVAPPARVLAAVWREQLDLDD